VTVARILFTVLFIVLVESVVCAVAAAPTIAYWLWLIDVTREWSTAERTAAFAASAVPSYGVFAILLLAASAASTRLTGARTSPDLEMRIRDFEWPLLNWVRYVASIHVARFVAGPLVRGSPIWTAYLRANGARIGRRVYVNTLSISDHNLLEFGDDVVIGADAHLSGHTVEHGIVKTGRVCLGRNVTVGLLSVVEIDVRAGDGAQIGALSFVPKHSSLEAGVVYAGVPVEPLRHDHRRSGGASR
jgi:acetyltransferase-like isoleucine patch superfamily enzyme